MNAWVIEFYYRSLIFDVIMVLDLKWKHNIGSVLGVNLRLSHDTIQFRFIYSIFDVSIESATIAIRISIHKAASWYFGIPLNLLWSKCDQVCSASRVSLHFISEWWWERRAILSRTITVPELRANHFASLWNYLHINLKVRLDNSRIFFINYNGIIINWLIGCLP